MSSIILEPGDIGQVAPFPPIVRPSDSTLFQHRAQRFAHLAHDHAMAPFLQAMSSLAHAQHAAFGARSAVPVAADRLTQSRLHGMPPLSFQASPADAGWQLDLASITDWILAHQIEAWLPAATALMAMTADQRDALAEAVLLCAETQTDQAAHALMAPVVGAALQVWWTRQAASLEDADIGHVGSSTLCPVCASRPVASIVEIGATQSNLRYLHCSLCSTDWHMVRVTCSSCEATNGIAYYSARGNEADLTASHKTAFVRAETCDACHSYLKIFTRDKQPLMDVHADDLATLTLDMLVDDAGYLRSGPNLLFAPGVIVETAVSSDNTGS